MLTLQSANSSGQLLQISSALIKSGAAKVRFGVNVMQDLVFQKRLLATTLIKKKKYPNRKGPNVAKKLLP